MKLADLLDPDIAAPDGAAQIEVTGLASDSRMVRPGYVFAALQGNAVDGAQFIPGAVKSGAGAVLMAAGSQPPLDCPVPVLQAKDPRRSLALMAARYYGRQPRHAVAVTGTSGKTSVAEFVRQIFAGLGHRAASVGTIGVVRPDGSVYGGLTTPDPVTLHETLAELADEGVTHLAFEASSHGLDQHRLDGVELSAAAFTNLGRDHMDYHPTVEHYLGAKLRLFRELLPADGVAIINADGAYAQEALQAVKESRIRCITVGRNGETLQLVDVQPEGFAQRLKVRAEGRDFDVRLPLIGAYQVENALVAAGLASVSEGIAPALSMLEQLEGVKGRLEIVGHHNGGLAVVDYAHKPEALSAALDAARPFATGRLICVFGCGGDRDAGKRPIMGDIAMRRADVVIVTDDNPRTEDAASIRRQILVAAPGAREIGDRRAAIREAVSMMGDGDVLLVAGKGHETGQIVGSEVLPFSDQDELVAAMG